MKELTEEGIKELRKSYNINWGDISYNTILSEELIREFQDKVNWYNICYKQILSEDFIREFQTKVNWDNISFDQFFKVI